MAKLGSLSLNTIVRVRTSSGTNSNGWITQDYLIVKKESTRVWLMTISRSTFGYYFSKNDDMCDLSKAKIEKYVYERILDSFVMSSTEISSLDIDLHSLTSFISGRSLLSGTNKGSFWTSTRASSTTAYLVRRSGSSSNITAVSDTSRYDIAPVIVLPTDIDVNGNQNILGDPSSNPESIPLQEISVAPSQRGTLTYNGNSQTPSWNNYDSTKLIIDGTVSGTNAATYTATFTPKAGYCWTGGSTATKSITWKIDKKSVAVPTVYPTSFEYNGSEHEPTITINNADKNYIDIGGTTKATNVGNYTITFTLTSTTNFVWSDGSTAASKSVPWSITRISIDIVPSQSGTLTYNGSSQTPKWNNYDDTKLTIGGVTSGTNATSYTATFTPKLGYSWAGGSTAAKNVTWKIEKKSVAIPTVSPTSFEYNGAEREPTITISSADKDYIKIGGTTKATNVNTSGYTITFTLTSTTNLIWSDGTTTATQSVKWYITHKKIDKVPTQKGTLIYNGSSQSPEWNDYYSTKMTIGGTTSGTNATTYKARFTPVSGYAWSDGSTSAKEVEWTIQKLKLTPPAQSGELIYNKTRQYPMWNDDYITQFMTIGGTTYGTDAGTYYATFKCNTNCYFNPPDTTSDTQATVAWVIKRSPTAVPPVIIDDKFEYDGTEHRPTWEIDDPTTVRLEGTLSEVNAGKYSITAYPTSNYSWSNNSTAGRPYEWEITRKPILKDPYLSERLLEYNGEEQFPQTVNYPQDFVSGSGLSGINAGTYTAVFTITDGNHCWTDGTYSPITIEWKIDRKKIAVITYYDTLIYNGREQSPEWIGYNEEMLEMSGDLSGVHAGEYTTIFTPTDNYQWSDGTFDPLSVSWEIDKYHYKYPFQAENRDPERPNQYFPDKSEYLQYNGEEQTPTLWFGNIYNKALEKNVLDKAFKAKKTRSAIKVGDYVMELTPDTDHCWEDGNSDPYDVPWKIVKAQLNYPFQNAQGLDIPSPKGEQYYTGETIYPQFDNYDPNILEISGQTSGVEVGRYMVYFEIKDKDNYEWNDGRTNKISVVWMIIERPKLIHHPYQTNHPIYNWYHQSPEWKGYDERAMMLIGGTPSEINVGKYEVQFSLKSGYAWYDGSKENAVVPWYIYKIPVPRPYIKGTDKEGFNGQFVEIDGKKYPVWVDYNPDLMTMSGDLYTVDEYPKLTVFTLKRPDIYRWEYSYEWSDKSSEPLEVRWVVSMPYDPETPDEFPGVGDSNIPFHDEDDYPERIPDWDREPNDPEIPDDDPPPNRVDGVGNPGDSLEDVLPDDIPGIITGGIADRLWKIGDVIPIKLNGEVGGVLFKDAWFYAYIIGFDHNPDIEGEKSIHFQFAKLTLNNKEIAFTDKYYGRTEQGKGFCMNTTDTAKGGWRDSYMRNTICKQFYEALPEEWRKIIISCPKYTDNVGDGSNSENSFTMTKDKIFLLSEYECLGRNVSANHAEDKYQQQYEYYKRYGYKGKGKYNSHNEEAECWLRSPYYDANDQFCVTSYSYYNPSGGCNGEYAADSYGFAPCFAVGGLRSPSAGGDYYDKDDPNKPPENLIRVHIPRQIHPPYEDGTVKQPQWDEYNDVAIINLGGEWNGIPADTYHVILDLRPGYIWEDNTTEIKHVPWKILALDEPTPPSPAPIVVHIPEQINPPYYDGTTKYPEWDEWNKFAIKIIGGDLYGVLAVKFWLKVELEPGYIWEDGTTEEKYLPWIILPRVYEEEIPSEDDPEIIEQDKRDPNKPYDPDDPNVDTGDNIPDNTEQRVNCCCCCDTGLFDKLNNAELDYGEECDCSKKVDI